MMREQGLFQKITSRESPEISHIIPWSTPSCFDPDLKPKPLCGESLLSSKKGAPFHRSWLCSCEREAEGKQLVFFHDPGLRDTQGKG